MYAVEFFAMNENDIEQKEGSITIHAAADAKLAIKRYAASAGLQQKALWSRLVNWFLASDEIVQAVAIGNIPKGMESAYATALRQMADRIEASPPEPESESPGSKQERRRLRPLGSRKPQDTR